MRQNIESHYYRYCMKLSAVFFLATSTITSTMITLGEVVPHSLPCSTIAGLLANVPPPLYSAVTPDSSPVRGESHVRSLSSKLSTEGMSPAPNSLVAPPTTAGSQDTSSLSRSSPVFSHNTLIWLAVCLCLSEWVHTSQSVCACVSCCCCCCCCCCMVGLCSLLFVAILLSTTCCMCASVLCDGMCWVFMCCVMSYSKGEHPIVWIILFLGLKFAAWHLYSQDTSSLCCVCVIELSYHVLCCVLCAVVNLAWVLPSMW